MSKHYFEFIMRKLFATGHTVPVKKSKSPEEVETIEKIVGTCYLPDFGVRHL